MAELNSCDRAHLAHTKLKIFAIQPFAEEKSADPHLEHRHLGWEVHLEAVQFNYLINAGILVSVSSQEEQLVP